VIRHYHGHLSGVFSLALHPLLDVLITGGRDSVARVGAIPLPDVQSRDKMWENIVTRPYYKCFPSGLGHKD
jgi:hypothetical protein